MHDKMDTSTASRLNITHVQCAKMARFSVQDGCIIFDMDVLDKGLLAVAGYKQCTRNTFIDLFNLDIETNSHEKALLKESKPYYSKEFTSLGANHRCFCFLTDVSFVTCCKDKIETYSTEINNGGLVKEQYFEGEALSMALRDGSVYVGLSRSSDVIVFDLDLNQVKRIVVAGFSSLECPWDILARNDTLFVCTFWSWRIVVYDSKSSGFWQLPDSKDSIAHDCTTPSNQHYAACSIAFSVQNSLLFILRVGSGNSFVEIYLFPSDLYTRDEGEIAPFGYTFCAAFNVPVDSIRIRFNETVNSLFVVTQKSGEVFEYDIGRMFESIPDVNYQAQFPGETLPAPSHGLYGRMLEGIQEVHYQEKNQEKSLSAPSHDHYATPTSIDEEESFHEETETSDAPVLKDQCTTVSLVEKLMITTEGGRIEIPNTGVILEIPPAALEREQLIEIRIIPTNFQKEEALPFARNSSVVVELLPSNLKLLKSAKLILPHCLVLKKDCEWKATVYTSHHEEDTQPLWEEDRHTVSELYEEHCVIWLQSFSWKKIEVGDKIVEAKTLQFFAARRPSSSDTDVYIDVGYYWDSPGCQQKITLHEHRTSFYKNGHLPLKILFVNVSSSMWTCDQDEVNPKEITFNRVLTSEADFCTFLLRRQVTSEARGCSCEFRVGQGSDLVDLKFELEVPGNSSSLNIDNLVTEKKTSIGRLIGSTSTLDFVVIESVLQVLARKIEDWKEIGRKLLLKEAELQTIEVENKKNVEAVYKMLLKWKRKNGKDASYRVLGEALKEADRKDLQDDLYDQVCYRVSEV
ncbi:uncharacterized protein [Apostichopus japonicus]|uniref:uncharacterized protein isoform X3 n=1 Tax=Stichopus japonicus TaxID=307972 RepID=UPI003AB261A7